jgi:iron complex transport system ATP-binding protein
MICVKNLCAGYYGKTIVKDVSMEFKPGEVLVLLGPNGSGKSTFLKAALGLLPAMDGEVLYDGVNMKKMKRKEIAQKAAFLSHPSHFSAMFSTFT